MYKLLVLDNNFWTELDLGTDKPAMTYQVNNIAELEDRQSDHSQSLKLPLTPKNCKFFDFLDSTFTDSNKPYKKYDCRLWASDILISGAGSVLNLISVTDCFNVQILSGFKSIFEILENLPMSDLSLGYFPRTETAMQPNNFPPEYEFAIASFTRGGLSYAPEMNPMYMLPFVYDRVILEAIFSNIGYSWVNNVTSYPEFYRLAKPIVNNLASANSFGSIFDAVSAISKPWQTLLTVNNYYLLNIINSGKGFLTSFGTDNSPSTCGNIFTAQVDCSIHLNYSGLWRGVISGLNLEVHLISSIAGVVSDEVLTFYTNVGSDTPVVLSRTYDLNKDDTITIMLRFVSPGTSGTAYCKLTGTLYLTNFTADTVPVNGLVEISKNLGFDNQASYLKTMLQELGLTIYVDHITKTVYTYTFQKLYDNKIQAIDWSDKLHTSKNRQTLFALDKYAQVNNILLKENSEDDVTNIGTFEVSDTTIAAKVDLFTVDLESGKDYAYGSTTRANIPVFSIPDLPIEPATYKDVELKAGNPHQIILSETTLGLLHVANHVTVQHLIDTYYDKLVNSMLVRAKVTTEYLFLEPYDIETFQPFVPIYLRQYGAYFYINKIIDFVENQITKVELIKL